MKLLSTFSDDCSSESTCVLKIAIRCVDDGWNLLISQVVLVYAHLHPAVEDDGKVFGVNLLVLVSRNSNFHLFLLLMTLDLTILGIEEVLAVAPVLFVVLWWSVLIHLYNWTLVSNPCMITSFRGFNLFLYLFIFQRLFD